MALSKAQIEGLEAIRDRYTPKEGFAAAYQLNQITKDLAEVLEDENVCIKLPYYDFNCHGAASMVNKDVMGVMPFSKCRIDYKDTTTLFYGDDRVSDCGTYLPFLSDSDCFFIASIDVDQEVIITLKKGASWRQLI